MMAAAWYTMITTIFNQDNNHHHHNCATSPVISNLLLTETLPIMPANHHFCCILLHMPVKYFLMLLLQHLLWRHLHNILHHIPHHYPHWLHWLWRKIFLSWSLVERSGVEQTSVKYHIVVPPRQESHLSWGHQPIFTLTPPPHLVIASWYLFVSSTPTIPSQHNVWKFILKWLIHVH